MPHEFERFLVYLQMGRGERSVRAAYFISAGITEYDGFTPRLPGSTWEIARRWHWKDRALAYDRAQDKKMLEAIEGRRLRSRLAAADLGETLRTKAQSAAKEIKAISRTMDVRDGIVVEIVTPNLSPEQIVRMAETGVKIEQLALGNPTDSTLVMGDPDRPVGITVETARDVLAQRLAQIRARREAGALPASTEERSTGESDAV